MRYFILIAAMFLISATAQAETSRGLTTTPGEEAPAAEQTKATEAPKAGPTNPDEVKPATDRVEKKSKRDAIEARVISELHRHGIYW
jgi:hypothetical protein